MPDATTPRPTECVADLLALGVDVEPVTRDPEHPTTHDHLTCLIEEPVIVHPPVLGVDLVTAAGSRTPDVLAGCAMARALVQTIEDLRPEGVTRIRHMGTYSCRVVSGTDRLSRHAFADAIDIAGFDFEDGTTLTVADDWEQGADPPLTEAGLWLFEAAHRWFDLGIWNVVLTPNYNLAHHDHFHVDLTPDARFIKDGALGYFGPAPFDD